MSRMRDTPMDCKVYVGDLGNDGNKYDLEEAFGKYGPIRDVWVARNPPGFAFVEFEDSRDARDSVRALDGKTLCGRRIRVELSTGRTRQAATASSRYRNDERCYDCGERGHYARDCTRARRRRSRSRSYSPRRSRSRSPRRSPRRERYSRSRSPFSPRDR